MELLHSGKVRDVYRDADDIILVASDRVSVYDIVLPTPIPDKGKILTALSLWWFEQMDGIVPHHVISTEVPADVKGRAIRCKPLRMVPVECVARGYLAGSGLTDYVAHGSVSGVRLPPGLVEAARLPEAIFTPTTKAPVGEHDRPMTFDDVAAEVGAQMAASLKEITLEVYRKGSEIAERRGLIIADTKIELGWDAEGVLTLGDEVLTPDSARFWPLDGWRPGRAQPSFDKQFVRDWAGSIGWDKRPPAPEIPLEIVEATRARYVAAYQRITGRAWQ